MLSFWSLISFQMSETTDVLRLIMRVPEAQYAFYFSYLESLCSSESSCGLFFEAVDSIGEKSLGRAMLFQGKGVRTKTSEGFSG